MSKKIRVIELFAGVGGFRLGLEGWKGKSPSSMYTVDMDSSYEVVWSNQWEPSTKIQHASNVYEKRFGGGLTHNNEDIAKVDVHSIPDFDMIVGGFPCQDYSVATTLKNSAGLIGKKGVLWWSINRILTERPTIPKYLLLENVDRILNSPSKQKGRDFAIILQSLNEVGYAVEWRVINAADYGMPQRRKRTFILAYSPESEIYGQVDKNKIENWILQTGVLAAAFPVSNDYKGTQRFVLTGDIVSISEDFNKAGKKSMFHNSGLMVDGVVTTMKTEPIYEGKRYTLGDMLDQGSILEDFFVSPHELPKWEILKNAKNEVRVTANGFEYKYSEGKMAFPDSLEKPARTIITGEGGKSPSRFKHIIKTSTGDYRRLTPSELERLNMFPVNHTLAEGVSDAKRAFFMGNALVVGIIEKIGKSLVQKISQYDRTRTR